MPLDERQLAALRQLGNEWQKNGKHRIYFDDLPAWYGLECEYYNSGNICSATLDGELISNSEARRIMGRLAGKLWYDLNENKFMSTDEIGNDEHSGIVTAIRAEMKERANAIPEPEYAI